MYGTYYRLYQRHKQYTDHSSDRFDKLPLLFLPHPNKELSKWLPLKVCVWDAAPCLRNVQPLARTFAKANSANFERIENFFTKVLRIRNAPIKAIIDEILELDRNAFDMTRAKELFVALSTTVKYLPVHEKPDLTQARSANIFPVKTGKSTFDLLSLRDTWFIPDRKREGTAFEGCIPPLDFSLTQQEDELGPLISALNLAAKRLSAHVREEKHMNGQANLNRTLTDSIKGKARYLTWYVADEQTT